MKNSLIILDWDDTLFPTSWVVNSNINLKNIINHSFMFNLLDKLVSKLLEQFLLCGDVIIITNAMTEWVNTSLIVLPLTKKVINNKINIVSARKLYQGKIDMSDWKIHTFKDYYNYQYDNIISIGDAEYEKNGLVQLYKLQGKRFLKNIKLIKNPDFSTLLDQLNIIIKISDNVCGMRKHIDLDFNYK